MRLNQPQLSGAGSMIWIATRPFCLKTYYMKCAIRSAPLIQPALAGPKPLSGLNAGSEPRWPSLNDFRR